MRKHLAGIAIAAVAFFGVVGSAQAWDARNFNAVDLGTQIVAGFTLCTHAQTTFYVRWRIDNDGGFLHNERYSGRIGGGYCHRFHIAQSDLYRNGWYFTRLWVGVPAHGSAISGWRDLRVW